MEIQGMQIVHFVCGPGDVAVQVLAIVALAHHWHTASRHPLHLLFFASRRARKEILRYTRVNQQRRRGS